MTQRILAIIVIYGLPAEQSMSYRTLLKAEQSFASDQIELSILLHDNTAGAIAPSHLPPHVRFFTDTANNGLASAYNRALAIALKEGYDWLLTLDQDTCLPADSFILLLQGIRAGEDSPEIAAVVPQIRASSRIISPFYFAAGALPRWFPPGFAGVPDQAVFALNSGALIRVSALRQIGGYSPWFWLDQSDLSLFQELRRYGKKVWIAGDLELQHDFSILDLQTKVSPERYQTMLLAESAFWDLNLSGIAGLERSARLAGRAVKQALRRDAPKLRSLTLQQLGQRIFHSRRHRLHLWKNQTTERLGTFLTIPPTFGPLRVSVCMAAFNGERYIEAQLNSILPQLKAQDEIVIVDDASRDSTPTLIRHLQQQLAGSLESPRLLFVQHKTNRGVVPTFEEALRSATGDVLFLCDDDDLWAPDKVQKVMAAFAANAAAQVVATGLVLIDEHDQPLTGSDYLEHRRFTANLAANFLHNQFQGSAMALRASLLRHILPFPKDRLFLHDAWIGARNTLTGGQTVYLDEPLLLYRRHTGNYSRRLSRWHQIKLRLQLLLAHLKQALRRS